MLTLTSPWGCFSLAESQPANHIYCRETVFRDLSRGLEIKLTISVFSMHFTWPKNAPSLPGKIRFDTSTDIAVFSMRMIAGKLSADFGSECDTKDAGKVPRTVRRHFSGSEDNYRLKFLSLKAKELAFKENSLKHKTIKPRGKLLGVASLIHSSLVAIEWRPNRSRKS